MSPSSAWIKAEMIIKLKIYPSLREVAPDFSLFLSLSLWRAFDSYFISQSKPDELFIAVRVKVEGLE